MLCYLEAGFLLSLADAVNDWIKFCVLLRLERLNQWEVWRLQAARESLLSGGTRQRELYHELHSQVFGILLPWLLLDELSLRLWICKLITSCSSRPSFWRLEVGKMHINGFSLWNTYLSGERGWREAEALLGVDSSRGKRGWVFLGGCCRQLVTHASVNGTTPLLHVQAALTGLSGKLGDVCVGGHISQGLENKREVDRSKPTVFTLGKFSKNK